MEELILLNFKDESLKDVIAKKKNSISRLSKSREKGGKRLGGIYSMRYEWYLKKSGADNAMFKNVVECLNSIKDDEEFEMWIIDYHESLPDVLFIKDNVVFAGLVSPIS